MTATAYAGLKFGVFSTACVVSTAAYTTTATAPQPNENE